MSDNNDYIPPINERPMLTGEYFPNISRLELLQMRANIALGRIPKPEGWVDVEEIELPIKVNPNNIVTDE